MAIVRKQCWTKFTVNNKINSSWLQYFIFVLTDEFPISESGVAFETLVSFKFYLEIQFRMQTVSGSIIPWVRHCVAWEKTTSARAPGVSKLIITPRSNHIKCDVQAHIRLPLDEYLWNSTLGFDLNQSDESCCWNHWLCVRAWSSVLASLHTCCLALILRMSSRPGKMPRGVATWLKKFCNVGRGGVLEKINGLIRP